MNCTMHILKNSRHNLASWLLRSRSLRCTFTSSYSSFRLFSDFWWVVRDPCFFKGCKTAQKVLWITLEHVQIVLRGIIFFQVLFPSEHARYSSCIQLSHVQMIIQNVLYAFSWNFYYLRNLTHLQFEVVDH